MDDRSFDRLARLLGEARDRRTGLKALVGGLIGAGGIAALAADADAKRNGKGDDRRRSDDAEADKKKKTCKPACESGFTCQKVGKKRQCVCPTGVTCGAACCAAGQTCVDGACRAALCDPPCANGFVCQGTTCACPSGVECGDACCASGQTCENGTCAGTPEPDRCIAAGQPCEDTGRACCAGLVCGSGQGGLPDVACYVPEDGPCARSAECVFGTQCTDGRCLTPPPPPGPPPAPVAQLGAACNPATDVCTSPGAVCQPYTGDRPVGLSATYCTLPLGAACTADSECSCYSCGHAEGARRGNGRSSRAAATTCCGLEGHACSTASDCCEAHACTGGACAPAACTVCAVGCAHATIAAAIQAGVADILVGAGAYTEHDLPLPSGPELRIRACGTAQVTIDAERLGRIMVPVTSGKTVTIQGVTLANGRATGSGGALRVETGGTLVLDRVTIQYSAATLDGGGISAESGTLRATGSTIAGCYADRNGGGISSKDGTVALTDTAISFCTAYQDYGGGLLADGGSVDLTRATISGNQLPYDDSSGGTSGGGVHLAGIDASTLTDCVIQRNFSYDSGGGLSIVSPAGDVDVIGGSISINDTIYYGGGGAYLDAGAKTITLRDVKIRYNRLLDHTMFGVGVWVAGGAVNFTGETAIQNNASTQSNIKGGGLWLEGGSVTLGPDAVVSGNAVSADGGGIYVAGGELTVEGTVRDNAATGSGGGIYAANKVNLRGASQVRGNTAASGAGIFATNGANTLVACAVPSATPLVCSNPGTNPSATTNCGGTAGKYTNCTDACLGGSGGTGACPPA